MWAISEGAGAVSLDVEVLLYGVLDLAAKAGFGFILLLSHDVRCGLLPQLRARCAASHVAVHPRRSTQS